MEIKRVGSQPSSRGSADYFTGAVLDFRMVIETVRYLGIEMCRPSPKYRSEMKASPGPATGLDETGIKPLFLGLGDR